MATPSGTFLRVGAIGAGLLAGVLIAGTAWTSTQPDSRGFVCENGDRFVVDFLPDHVRLRHGSGVFALAEVKPGRVWSDGRMVLQAGQSAAILELPGIEEAQSCVVSPA